MLEFLPLFPLNLVAFPKEKLNLHIFEPRYKQMMQDVLEGDRKFGVVAFVTDAMDYGTEVEVEQVVRVYPDGRMDIRTVGSRVFRVQNMENPLPDRLYAGGEVEFLPFVEDSDPLLQEKLCKLLEEFFVTIQLGQAIELSEDLRTFEIAHRIGMSAEQKYHLLQIPEERKRQEVMIEHLRHAIPLLRDVEKTKDRVRMNGHFRHFDPLSF